MKQLFRIIGQVSAYTCWDLRVSGQVMSLLNEGPASASNGGRWKDLRLQIFPSLDLR